MFKTSKLPLALFFHFIIPLFTCVYAQEKINYYPIRIDYKWGAIDSTSNIILPPKYEYVGKFSPQQLAIVKLSGKYGVVNADGKQVLDPVFDNIRFTRKEVALVAKSGKWGLANLIDSTITSTQYDLIQDIEGGHFKIFKDSLVGLCDATGSVIFPPIFTEISLSKPPFFFFQKNGNRGMGTTARTPTGDVMIIPAQFDSLAFIDNELVACMQDSLMGIYNTAGQEVLSPTYASITLLGERNSPLLIQKKGKHGVISRDGEVLIPPKYHFVADAKKHFIVSNKELWGVADSTGNQLTEICWKTYELYSDDFILLKKNRGFAGLFSHQQKKIVFEGNIQNVQTLDNGFLEIATKKGIFIIVRSGKLLTASAYHSYKFLSDSYVAFSKDSLWGVFDLEGDEIVPCKYDFIYPFPSGFPLTKAKKNGLVGLINKRGRELLTPSYTRIEVFSTQAKGYEKGGGVRTVQFSKKGTLLDSYRIANVFSISLSGKKNAPTDSIRFSASRPSSRGNWSFNSGTRRDRVYPVPIGRARNWWALYSKRDSTFIGLAENRAFRFIYKFGRNKLYWGLRNARGSRTTIKRRGQKKYEKIGYVGEFKEDLVRVNIGGMFYFEELRYDLDTTYQLDNLKSFLSNRFLHHLRNTYLQISAADVPFCEGGSWGFMNFKGKMVIPAEYDFVHDFVEGQAIAKKNGKWGVIDKFNGVVIPFEYSHISLITNAKDQLYLLTKAEMLSGYINTQGRQVIPTDFLELHEFKEGLAKVLTSKGWGFIDEKGEFVIADTLDYANDFSEGLAAFRKEGLWGFIDQQGKIVIEPVYQEVGNFKDGKTWVKLKGRKGIIDRNGRAIVPPKFYKIEDFDRGVARVYVKGKWGLMNTRGEWVVSPKFAQILPFDEHGLAQFKQKGWGLIDTLGNAVVKPKFSKIGSFSEGLAYVRTKSNNFNHLKYGYIDVSGEYVIKPKYRAVGNFKDSLASAKTRKSRFWGYINTEGQFALQPEFYGAEDFNEGVAVVYTKPGKKEGAFFIDKQGDFISQGYFTPLKTYHEGRAVVKQGDYVNYIDDAGNLILKELNIDASNFQYQVAFVQRKNKKWALIDPLCIPLTEAKFDQVSSFNKDALAKVGIFHKYGIADRAGNVIIKASCDDILPYGDNVIQLKRGDEIGYLNIKGEWIWQFRK